MIYFDGAATSYPKPGCVIRAVNEAMIKYGGNPGRSGHSLSIAASDAVYRVREKAAEMFDASPENVVFTSNCTHSINLAVKGLAEQSLWEQALYRQSGRIHVIISCLEHNSVARPVYELTKRGLEYSIAEVYADDDETIGSFESCITPSTKAVVCTLGSNVTGQLLPFKKIGEMCRRRNICFIGDGAQVCGAVPVSLEKDGINILCMPGHKGLFGISGTGLLITDGKYPLYHIMEGGTGSYSLELEQGTALPESLESGTLNTAGIVSVGSGIDFIKHIGIENIRSHEDMLCRRFLRGLENIRGARIYRKIGAEYLPIVLFNIDGFTSEETAQYLSEKGFALRGGLHCSGLAHKTAGTLPDGGVRFAPSCFNTAEEVDLILNVIACMKK